MTKEAKTKEKLKYYRDLKKHMKGCLNSKRKEQRNCGYS